MTIHNSAYVHLDLVFILLCSALLSSLHLCFTLYYALLCSTMLYTALPALFYSILCTLYSTLLTLYKAPLG